MSKKKNTVFGGKRNLTVRVKTARGRKTSSTRWLQRQLNDPYVQQAKRDGYHSRAAYKLLEIDEKYHLLRAGQTIVDLGAAPGGWSQVAAQKVMSGSEKPRVVAVDVLEMPAIKGVHILQCDIQDEDAPERICELLDGKADVVLSDMAPNTIGHAATDHLRIITLCELAYDFALDVLKPGGAFICKVRQGGAEHTLLQDMKQKFSKVSHFKPESSRKESPETYVVAVHYKGK